MTAALLTLLTPKGIRLDGGFGGIPDTTWTDVSSALAKAPYAESYCTLMAEVYFDPRAKSPYIGETDVDNFKDTVRGHTLTVFYKEGWKPPQGWAQVLDIAKVISGQFLGGYVCWHCDGAGAVENKDCKVCNGSAAGQIPDYIRAELMKIPLPEYKSTWASRVAEIEALIQTWKSSGMDHLRRHL